MVSVHRGEVRIDVTAVVRLREGGEQRMQDFTNFVMSPAKWPAAGSGDVGAWKAWAKEAEAEWVYTDSLGPRLTRGYLV